MVAERRLAASLTHLLPIAVAVCTDRDVDYPETAHKDQRRPGHERNQGRTTQMGDQDGSNYVHLLAYSC